MEALVWLEAELPADYIAPQYKNKTRPQIFELVIRNALLIVKESALINWDGDTPFVPAMTITGFLQDVLLPDNEETTVSKMAAIRTAAYNQGLAEGRTAAHADLLYAKGFQRGFEKSYNDGMMVYRTAQSTSDREPTGVEIPQQLTGPDQTDSEGEKVNQPVIEINSTADDEVPQPKKFRLVDYSDSDSDAVLEADQPRGKPRDAGSDLAQSASVTSGPSLPGAQQTSEHGKHPREAIRSSSESHSSGPSRKRPRLPSTTAIRTPSARSSDPVSGSEYSDEKQSGDSGIGSGLDLLSTTDEAMPKNRGDPVEFQTSH
ncbi:hypothetical protein BC567DRAFT_261646 [Phyllosticta citribraziliensis]